MRRRGQAGTTRTQTCWSVVRVHTGHCTKVSTDCALHTMKRHPVHHRIRHDCRLQIVQRAHCALHNPAGQEWTKWAVLGAGGASGCAAGCEPEVPAGQWPPTSCCSNTFQLVDNVRVKLKLSLIRGMVLSCAAGKTLPYVWGHVVCTLTEGQKERRHIILGQNFALSNGNVTK